MSVIIEKLILPKSGGVITYSTEITIYPNGKAYFRDNNHNFRMAEIPTPLYGRLIDADELKKKLEKHREMCGDIELAHGIDVSIRILNNTPTIIEAGGNI